MFRVVVEMKFYVTENFAALFSMERSFYVVMAKFAYPFRMRPF